MAYLRDNLDHLTFRNYTDSFYSGSKFQPTPGCVGNGFLVCRSPQNDETYTDEHGNTQHTAGKILFKNPYKVYIELKINPHFPYLYGKRLDYYNNPVEMTLTGFQDSDGNPWNYSVQHITEWPRYSTTTTRRNTFYEEFNNFNDSYSTATTGFGDGKVDSAGPLTYLMLARPGSTYYPLSSAITPRYLYAKTGKFIPNDVQPGESWEGTELFSTATENHIGVVMPFWGVNIATKGFKTRTESWVTSNSTAADIGLVSQTDLNLPEGRYGILWQIEWGSFDSAWGQFNTAYATALYLSDETRHKISPTTNDKLTFHFSRVVWEYNSRPTDTPIMPEVRASRDSFFGDCTFYLTVGGV